VLGAKSRFDFDFDLLHDVLYQDKDYEIAYLTTAASRSLAILKNGSRTSRLLRQGILGEGSTGKRCRPDQRPGSVCGMQLHRASGADEELLWLLGLADPVHLDDDHAFAADVG